MFIQKGTLDTDDDNTNEHFIITNESFNDSSNDNDVIELSNYSEQSEFDNEPNNQKKLKKSSKNANDDNKLLGLANIALKNESDITS